VSLPGAWSGQCLSSGRAWAPVQVGAIHIEGSHIPELLRRLPSRNRADPGRIGPVAVRVEGRGVGDHGYTGGSTVGKREDSTELPTSGDLGQHTLVQDGLTLSERQFVQPRGNEPAAHIELRQTTLGFEVIAVHRLQVVAGVRTRRAAVVD